MLIDDLQRSGAIFFKWPTIINGEKVINSQIEESITCKSKCKISPVCASNAQVGEHTCLHGLSYINIKLFSGIIKIYGVRGENNKTKLNIYTRHGLRGRYVLQSDLDVWIRSIRRMMEAIENNFMTRQSEMLDPLHDPMRIAKQIGTIANKLVQNESKGRGFDEKINNSSIELKTLVKAADFLGDSFELLSIYFNPEAATFGGKAATGVHGLLTKLVSIFRIDDNGLTKSSTKIYFDGSCHRNIFVFDSFKLIPFSLISNAVKYSVSGNINVRIDDRRGNIEISVESVGPLIEESEFEKIFERRGRGRWAEKFSEGKGVGLYLASIISKAHGFDIRVSSRKNGDHRDGVPLALNRFHFEIPAAS